MYGTQFEVIEEWTGREGSIFLKLADGSGWLFSHTRFGTYCKSRTGAMASRQTRQLSMATPGSAPMKKSGADRRTGLRAYSRDAWNQSHDTETGKDWVNERPWSKQWAQDGDENNCDGHWGRNSLSEQRSCDREDH